MDATNFHNMIIAEFGLSQFNSDEQLQYIDYIGELVLQGVLIKSLTALDNSQAEELESMVDSGKDPSEILTFLQTNIPGFNEIIKGEISTVKQDLTNQTG